MHERLYPIASRLQQFFDSAPIDWQETPGGYSEAHRGIVTLKSGKRVFVKVATNEKTNLWLHHENAIYQYVQAAFMPKYYGFIPETVGNHDAILILEDLSAAHWPPPWTDEIVTKVQDALKKLNAIDAPDFLPSMESRRSSLGGWAEVKRNPLLFLTVGTCSEAWLSSYIDTLVQAEEAADLSSETFVHMDIRSGNLCVDDGQVKFLDWSHAEKGNAALDLIFWLPSLALEGGSLPEEIITAHPNLLALVSGYFARTSGPALEKEGRDGRIFRLKFELLGPALYYTCKTLGIPQP